MQNSKSGNYFFCECPQLKNTLRILCIASPLSDVDFSFYWFLKDHEFVGAQSRLFI